MFFFDFVLFYFIIMLIYDEDIGLIFWIWMMELICKLLINEIK